MRRLSSIHVKNRSANREVSDASLRHLLIRGSPLLRLLICLPIVRAAFVAPRIVRLPEDRKPLVTMFLPTYLEANVTDANLKVQISDAISYVREQRDAPCFREFAPSG